jgi:hypothetical protein
MKRTVQHSFLRFKENRKEKPHIVANFQQQTKSQLKLTVFWVTAPCSLVETHQRFRYSYCPDGGSTHLSNVGQFLPNYTAQHPRRSHCHAYRDDNLKFQKDRLLSNKYRIVQICLLGCTAV